MSILRGLIALIFIFGIGYLFSTDRKNINYKPIATMIVLQLIITFISLNTSGGISLLTGISNFFSWLMEQAAGGTSFVFGGLELQPGGFVFFFNVLMPLVFISALVGILNYIKVLPFIIKWIGKGISKITGMGELESYFSVSTAVLGQPEVFMTIRNQISKLSSKQLYTICASSMSAVSAAMLASYMQMVEGKFVVVAVFLNIFSSLIISSLINPYDPKVEDFEGFEETDVVSQDTGEEKEHFFQMLGSYILEGWHLALIVAAMLVGFVSLVTFLNNSFDAIFHITFTAILGWGFSPIAYLIGIPFEDIIKVGSIMATKLITNEFVAMGELGQVVNSLSPKAAAMISTYLISFANFGTLGIVSGSIKAIDAKQGKLVAGFSMKLLLGATMASLLTASIVGFFF